MGVTLSAESKPVDDGEFLDIAKGEAEARQLRRTLETLAEHGNGTVKEMARDVLAGRVGLREAVSVSSYSEALVETARPFQEKWGEMSDAERQQLAAEGERNMEEERQRIAAERAEKQRREGGSHRPRHGSDYP